jgi:hypothetical protein
MSPLEERLEDLEYRLARHLEDIDSQLVKINRSSSSSFMEGCRAALEELTQVVRWHQENDKATEYLEGWLSACVVAFGLEKPEKHAP